MDNTNAPSQYDSTLDPAAYVVMGIAVLMCIGFILYRCCTHRVNNDHETTMPIAFNIFNAETGNIRATHLGGYGAVTEVIGVVLGRDDGAQEAMGVVLVQE